MQWMRGLIIEIWSRWNYMYPPFHVLDHDRFSMEWEWYFTRVCYPENVGISFSPTNLWSKVWNTLGFTPCERVNTHLIYDWNTLRFTPCEMVNIHQIHDKFSPYKYLEENIRLILQWELKSITLQLHIYVSN